jgi:EAL domain-containing protein (putative c-di-GMP-specific phosphodiesterase class I)
MAAAAGGTAEQPASQQSDAQEAPADSLEARMQTAERFAEALKQDQFTLFGQPIASLAAGKTGRRQLEIFVRFREEEEHLLPPGTFLPILEANHLTPLLDRWEVQKVLHWSTEKRKAKPDWQIPSFNINLADDTILDADFPRHVLDSLFESRVPPDRLWFEVTARQLFDLGDAAKKMIAALKGLGCAVAVSDFAGTESDARDYRATGVQLVKLARSVIRDIDKSQKAMASLLGVNGACHRAGLQTIAQFVETTETLMALRKAGVDYAQGFRIAVPVPLALLN